MLDAQTLPLLHVDQVSKHYASDDKVAQRVLDTVSLQLYPGEIVAILGKSGSGKSTLLRVIAGLLPPSSGKVLYKGETISRPVAGISMVFQTFALFPWLNVLENVELGLEAIGVRPAECKQRALKMLDRIGLDGFESAYPKELSGGMRQRVGFARALVVQPDILLMDEAFSALDVATAEMLRTDLLDLWGSPDAPIRSIVMVSHNIEESVQLADRIIIFDSNPGRIKQEIRVEIPHPRDSASTLFRQTVERIYNIITQSESGVVSALSIGHRLPEAGSNQLAGVMEEIASVGDHGQDLSELTESLHMEIDDLFPIIDGLQLLRFVSVTQGHVYLNESGRRFVEADILQRKLIFAEQLRRHIPLANHILRILNERASQKATRQRFLSELEDYVSDSEAERVLSVVIEWGRYAELFAYHHNSEILSMEDPGDSG